MTKLIPTPILSPQEPTYRFLWENHNDMKKTKEIIEKRILEISKSTFKNGIANCTDEYQYRISLEKCYLLISNFTCQKWVKSFSAHHPMNIADIPDFTMKVSPANIPSALFKRHLGYSNSESRKSRIAYTVILKILEESNIIHVNNRYSTGTDTVKAFTKSYRLSRNFMCDLLKTYIETNPSRFSIYDCFHGWCPNLLMEQQIKTAKELYATIEPHDGINVALPPKWEDCIAPFGWFRFNPDLTVERLIKGLRAFTNHRQGEYTGSRMYDWFTLCPKSFRQYLFKGGRHYREVVDCPSGIVWMFSMFGYQSGRISHDECLKMIRHCFYGDFYKDVAEVKDKTTRRIVKTTFMQVLNADKRAENFHKNILETPYFLTIERNLKSSYPEWYAYLKYLQSQKRERMSFLDTQNVEDPTCATLGRFNHYATTQIERNIIERLIVKLERQGLTDLHRVHDAVWGLENVVNANEILFETVMEYFDSIAPAQAFPEAA